MGRVSAVRAGRSSTTSSPTPPGSPDTAPTAGRTAGSSAQRPRTPTVPGARAPEIQRYREALEAVLGTPFTPGNRIEPLENGERIFPAMLEAIAEARDYIDMETYVYWDGAVSRAFAEALADAGGRGVRVRVLIDAFGGLQMPFECERIMREGGVDVRRYRPFTLRNLPRIDQRAHRKILVCDGEVGFTGGVGIARQWEGDARNPDEWRDTHFRIRGPAVAGLWSGFVADWLQECPDFVPVRRPWSRLPCDPNPRGNAGSLIQVIRTGSSHSWSDIATAVRTLVPMARERIRICTAYFVPDPTLVRLLTEAVDRGVRVQVLTPGPHVDHRVSQLAGEFRLGALLEGGVEHWSYLPTMLHAKIITIDGVLSMLGSANLNQRSLRKDQELSLMVLDVDLTAALDASFERDLQRAEPTRPEAWAGRGALQRVLEVGASLLRRQL